jgi:urease accessory protein
VSSGAERTVASIRFRAGIGGEPILADVSASPFHSFEPAAWGAMIVGASAHPVGGDHHGLKVDVAEGCCAEIRTAAASVARSGPPRPGWSAAGGGSTLTVRATVARDAMLTWKPEPGVAADGCNHRVDSTVSLSAGARLLWRDEFILERRSGTAPGTWSSSLRVVRDGWPVICRELAVGPGSPLWESPAVLEGARAVSLMVVVDPEQPAESWSSARATEGSATGVALPLAGPGVQMVAWGDHLCDCRTALERIAVRAGTPDWAGNRWRTLSALDTI